MTYRRNSDVDLRHLERQILADSTDIVAWKKLIAAHQRTFGTPLLVTFFAGKEHPDELKRRWITQEILDINSVGNYLHLHVLPRGYPYANYRSYKGARMEEPYWSMSPMTIAEGLHFGPMTEKESLINASLEEKQNERDSYYDDE